MLPIDFDTVNCTPAGIQLLARSSAWKKVVEVSECLAYDEYAFSVTFKLRAVALFRLKMFDELSVEVSMILQKAEFDFGNCKDGNKDSIARCADKIIALQLLLIEVKTMTGRGEDAMNQLYSLQRWLGRQSEFIWPPTTSANKSQVPLWWKWRIIWAIINNLVKQRQWRQSLRELQSLLRDIQTSRRSDMHPQHARRIITAEIIILSRMSRIFVQANVSIILKFTNVD